MNLTLLVVGERNFDKILQELEKDFILDCEDFNVVFLTRKAKEVKIKTKISFQILEFKNAKENEMLEYAFANLNLKNVLLFKESYTNFKTIEANKMLEKLAKKNFDLITSKQNKKNNILTRIFKEISNFFIKLFTGCSVYKGEADIMFISEFAVSIVKQSPNKSAKYLKLNNFSGINEENSSISVQQKNKKPFDFKNFKICIILYFVLLAMITCNICLACLNVNITTIVKIVYILLEVTVFGIAFFATIKFLIFAKFGKLNFINEATLTQTIVKGEIDGQQNN